MKSSLSLLSLVAFLTFFVSWGACAILRKHHSLNQTHAPVCVIPELTNLGLNGEQKVALIVNEVAKEALRDAIRPVLVRNAAIKTAPVENGNWNRMDQLAKLTDSVDGGLISISLCFVKRNDTKNLLFASNEPSDGETVIKNWIKYLRAKNNLEDAAKKYKDAMTELFPEDSNDLRKGFQKDPVRKLGVWLIEKEITEASVLNLNASEPMDQGVYNTEKTYHGELKIVNYLSRNGIENFKTGLTLDGAGKIYIGVDKTACQKCHRAYQPFAEKLAYAGSSGFSFRPWALPTYLIATADGKNCDYLSEFANTQCLGAYCQIFRNEDPWKIYEYITRLP